MKKKEPVFLDFAIDKLTNSIQNTVSGDSFQTEIHRLTINDLKKVTRANGWNFDWDSELADSSKEIYKLTIVNNSDIIQGLLSLTIEKDHVLMNLLESAPFNIGKDKLYEGVAGNLVAYSCKISYQQGFDGYVVSTSKTKLIKHYEEALGAFHIGGQRMIIPANAAEMLVERYFKHEKMGHIKEPKGVDFIIESKPLTDEERKEISKFIRSDKANASARKKLSERTKASKKKQTTD